MGMSPSPEDRSKELGSEALLTLSMHPVTNSGWDIVALVQYWACVNNLSQKCPTGDADMTNNTHG